MERPTQVQPCNMVASQLASIRSTTMQPSNSFPSAPFRPCCIHSSQLRVGRARVEPGDCGEAAAGNAGGGPGSRRAARQANGLTDRLISRLSPPPPPPQVNAMDGLKKSIVRCGRERGASVIISCGNGASQDSPSGGAQRVIGSHCNAKVPKFQEWRRSWKEPPPRISERDGVKTTNFRDLSDCTRKIKKK